MHKTQEKEAKLKVLLLESSPNWGGQEERLLREASWLREHRHNVALACNGNSAIAARATAAGIRSETISMRSAADLRGLISLSRLVVTGRPDIIHAHSPKDAWLCFWFHSFGVPVTRSRHTTFPRHMPARRGFIYRHGCRRLIASAGFIAQAMHDSLGVAKDRIDVIGECVNTSEFCPGDGVEFRKEFGIDKSAPLFGVVAMLRGEKGHDVFLRAAKIAAQQRPDARFVIVGDAASRRRVKQEIQKTLGTEFYGFPTPPVMMTGFRRDIPEVMRALDFLVVPSRREAQTLVIPQAFATGKPVIASKVGGIPELVEHGANGLLFESEDHDSLAAAMLELAADPHRAARMGRAGRKLAEEELAIDRKMELLLASYRKCVAAR